MLVPFAVVSVASFSSFQLAVILLFVITASRLTCLQSDENLRGLRVARQQQLSLDICCLRPTSAANLPAAAAVDRRDRQTDDGRTLDRFMTLTAYYAGRVIIDSGSVTARMANRSI